MLKLPREIVCFYSDLGRPYLPLIKRMTESARAAMPDCTLTLITTTPKNELVSLFDTSICLDTTCDTKNICFVKARAIVTWQNQLKAPAVFVDPDIEFRDKIPSFGDVDVALLRTKKSAHPINSSFIYATPGNELFWRKYGNAVASLPTALHAWFADQIAMSILIGSGHEAGEIVPIYGSRIRLLDYEKACCEPERAKPEAFAIHYKGSRKGDGWGVYYKRDAIPEGAHKDEEVERI